MKFYELSQNNTGGSFAVDSKLCHRLFIEAESEKAALEIAEGLGCYWNGVDDGMDCSCCGDRWYKSADEVDLEKMNTKWNGYEISEWLGKSKNTHDEDAIIQNLKAQYPDSVWLVEPMLENKYGSTRVVGKIRLDSVEQYAQIMANLYGWTKPDCRIFYANGGVKEIFRPEVK
jgi:hypothetical protein